MGSLAYATSTGMCTNTVPHIRSLAGKDAQALNLALYAHRVTIKQSVSEKRSNLWGRRAGEASERHSPLGHLLYCVTRLQNFPARSSAAAR